MNVAVIIPALNAAPWLPEVLERTKKIVSDRSIFVINDGSTDHTGGIAKSFSVHVITHQTNRGKGAALRTGFDKAVEMSFDAVVTMDADLQHQPEDIPKMIAAHHDTNCDIVIGSRITRATMPLHRILSNTITTFLVQARTGKKILDSQSGFRLIMRQVLEKVSVQSDGFEAETEFIIKAAACGCTFGSVPIATLYAGERSNMTHLHTTMNFIRILFKQY